ncbi:MAG: hypothetical protein IJO96_07355 [Oscillospiraceae bacterium]|nr:hypothetical protein [Oscillospiraceae bacterium]
MTTRERVQKILKFEKPDRLPVFEHAPYWNKTVDRWHTEGLDPSIKSFEDVRKFFGLDIHYGVDPCYFGKDCPPLSDEHPLMEMNEKAYMEMRPKLFPKDAISGHAKSLERIAKAQQDGTPIYYGEFGFFWFPRMLVGIEPHLYSFYDEPELYHRICEDTLEFNMRCLEEVSSQFFVPDLFILSEDMSYNAGPMLSEEMFDEFLLPYYLELNKVLKKHSIPFAVDSDGFVEPMIPWLKRGGVEGVWPMEVRAGVDANRVRANYPDLLMFSSFDKIKMSQGREAMEAEFQRLLPAMKSGGFIPSCDHQTPPQVSFEQYKIYVELLHKYARLACE